MEPIVDSFVEGDSDPALHPAVSGDPDHPYDRDAGGDGPRAPSSTGLRRGPAGLRPG
jgi:hypothetical protein